MFFLPQRIDASPIGQKRSRSISTTQSHRRPNGNHRESPRNRGGGPPAANGESGALAGDGGTELDSPDGTERDGGRAIVMLRVTAGATSAAAAVEGEKEEYLRSLPRPWSGRGPATVSSQSWARSPMPRTARNRFRSDYLDVSPSSLFLGWEPEGQRGKSASQSGLRGSERPRPRGSL